MGKYDDIIGLSRPKSMRPAMPVADRAKIFMPFAALRGYEDAIGEQQRLFAERVELSDEEQEKLDMSLQRIAILLANGVQPEVSVKYFVKNEEISKKEEQELGVYKICSGKITKLYAMHDKIRIQDMELWLHDITEITGEFLEDEEMG